MVRIEIDVPRPWSMLFWSVALIGGFVWYTNTGAPQAGKVTADISAQGGTQPAAITVAQAENNAKTLRIRQTVLDKQEATLRSELDELDSERSNDPAYTQQLEDARTRLANLISNKQAGEQEIAKAFDQIWAAQGYAMAISKKAPGDLDEQISLIWPIAPTEGISAHFSDIEYQKRFGMPHQAIDIPTPQNSVVSAAAAGVVAKVSDNGMGFNSIIIKHSGGYATLYGHVTKFLVSEGDQVTAGEAIALSGGTPGTPGAGHMTTGPHLHFQLLKDGLPADPEPYLSKVSY